MKLVQVQVRNFRNILDSGEVNIEPDVTCLVGKNESGKTAFLQALHRLNPAQENASFSIPEHYPAWLEKQHRRKMELSSFCPVTATFKVEDSDRAILEERFGKGFIKSDTLTLRRQYDNQAIFDYVCDEQVAMATILERAAVPSDLCNELTDIAGVDVAIASLKARKDHPESTEAATRLEQAKTLVVGKHGNLQDATVEALRDLTPKFFYYSDYSRLPGTIKIRELLKADRTKLNDNQLTALALLELAGAEDDYLLNPDYERRKRELENVANALTQEILEYWTTNREIRVDIDITQETVKAPTGQQAVIHELKVRLWDNRHFLSLPFDERSSGFRWFFSFLAAFSAYRDDDSKKVILLLDEPALGLHARAQKISSGTSMINWGGRDRSFTRLIRHSWFSPSTSIVFAWWKIVEEILARRFRRT